MEVKDTRSEVGGLSSSSTLPIYVFSNKVTCVSFSSFVKRSYAGIKCIEMFSRSNKLLYIYSKLLYIYIV